MWNRSTRHGTVDAAQLRGDDETDHRRQRRVAGLASPGLLIGEGGRDVRDDDPENIGQALNPVDDVFVLAKQGDPSHTDIKRSAFSTLGNWTPQHHLARSPAAGGGLRPRPSRIRPRRRTRPGKVGGIPTRILYGNRFTAFGAAHRCQFEVARNSGFELAKVILSPPKRRKARRSLDDRRLSRSGLPFSPPSPPSTVRLKLRGILEHRDVALRAVATACKMVTERRRGAAWDEFRHQVLSAVGEGFNNIVLARERRERAATKRRCRGRPANQDQPRSHPDRAS